jgi:DNA-binding NarL/FixJ family response regulator
MDEAITVLLVDDHAVVREGYRRLLEREPDIRVAGEAASVDEALQRRRELAPQVIVMDISLPGCSGIEGTRRLVAEDPSARILVFSMHEDIVYARRALQAGARGYLAKSGAPETLVAAVRQVAAGERHLDPSFASLTSSEGPDALSPREFEVLQRLVRGEGLREIAEALGVTTKTVANQQSMIRQKLHAETPVQLLRAAEILGVRGSG